MEYLGVVEENLNSNHDLYDVTTSSFQKFTQSIAKVYSDKLCLRFYEEQWNEYSFIEFEKKVLKLARFLTKKNLLIKKF